MLKPKKTFRAVVKELVRGLRNGETELRDRPNWQVILVHGVGERPQTMRLELASPQTEGTRFHFSAHGSSMGSLVFRELLTKMRQADPELQVEEAEGPAGGSSPAYDCLVLLDACRVQAFAHGMELWLDERPKKDVLLRRRGAGDFLRITSPADARRLPELLIRQE